VGPCHHGMARPRVADGRGRPPDMEDTANMLNKQPGQPARGSLQAWGGEGCARGSQLLTVNNQLVAKCFTGCRT
jgi:hypothetical protein